MKCMYCNSEENVQHVDNNEYIFLCELCTIKGIYEFINIKQLNKKISEIALLLIDEASYIQEDAIKLNLSNKKICDINDINDIKNFLKAIQENIDTIEKLISTCADT